ncbi:Sodium-dependent glucose transporter 1 [Pseudolycoriella hygida]|uniref:Sodium-dependent glucose transporter 1 n=1 Tax=Pseudolycoriella hygida TaxID=35572 RepID=A0A9Q0N4Q4_9DIPT|nr:Sodium-dependent glucose transporter 1 [Pseudolycoriella hygida]
MGFINEIKTHRYRTLKAVCTSLLFAGLGLHSAAYGPSLLDLSIQVNTSIDQITHILPLRAFGNMIGSTICGFILGYFDHQIVLIFSMLIMSLSIIFVPLCATLWSLYAVMLFNGLGSGVLVNAGNCWVMHKWGKENSPFMQLAHFCFGLGAFFSPFIIEPFLTEVLDADHTVASSSSNATIQPSTNTTEIPLIIDPSSLKLRWGYFILGGLSLIIWALMVITYLNKRDNKPHPTRDVKVKTSKTDPLVGIEIVNPDESEEHKSAEKKLRPYHKYIIVLLAALFIHLVYGLELSFGVMLAPYARLSDLHFSKSSASFVSSLYWGCFTFFRLCTLILINFVSPRTVLIIELGLVMVSNAILLPFLFITSYSGWALWVGSAFMGVGVSSMYPTLWSFVEEIVPVTSKMNSIVNSCACVGEFIVPVIIGAYIEQWPNVYICIVFIYSALACLVFALCVIWEYIINKHKRS